MVNDVSGSKLMDQIVIYEREGGGVSVLYPSANCGLTLDEIIRRDVPSGVRYKKISRDDMPADREYREAWTFDFSDAEVNP